MIDAHDPLHPEPLRGVNHNVEKPCPASQQVESAAAENHAGPLNRQFGNEAAFDLLQLFIGGPVRRRWRVDVFRGSHLEDRNQFLPKARWTPFEAFDLRFLDPQFLGGPLQDLAVDEGIAEPPGNLLADVGPAAAQLTGDRDHDCRWHGVPPRVLCSSLSFFDSPTRSRNSCNSIMNCSLVLSSSCISDSAEAQCIGSPAYGAKCIILDGPAKKKRAQGRICKPFWIANSKTTRASTQNLT